MEAHFLFEQESMKHTVRVCDRTAIDPIVYAILTSRDEEESRSKENHLTRSANFQKALQQYRKSIVILLKPVAEWMVDDGIRSTENQDECLQIYRRLLAEMDVPYYEFGREIMFLPERVGFVIGSEQALAPVREPDTFAEGAWDKVPKTEGTFDRVLLNTTSHSYYKGWIDVLFICIRVLRTNFREKLPSQKILFSTKDVSHLKSHILEYHSIFVLAISKLSSSVATSATPALTHSA